MTTELITPTEPDTLASFIVDRFVEMFLLEVDEDIAQQALHKLKNIVTVY